MLLEVGNAKRISDPTPEQIDHYLRFMPPQSPFLILSAATDRFMQATPAGDLYRVELRQGKRQYYAHVSLEAAARLFQTFGRGDQAAAPGVAWRRLRVFNDPYNPAVLAAWVALLIGLAVIGVWTGSR